MRHAVTAVWVLAFVGCIAGANWAILNVGTDHGAGLPHTLPAGFGLESPSGVLFAGAQLTLRDFIQERLGAWKTLAVITISAPLTALVASPALALASVITFLAAEFADLACLQPIAAARIIVAVLGSNVTSAIVDSVLFLALAFGFSQAAAGTVGMSVGKLEASGAVLIAVAALGGLIRPLSTPRRGDLARV
ncbi:hypothetical protein BKG69_15875 [Mycobacteroides chelonae]|nr:hypothetical protein BKG69_15875 [Mycobacteroides chelonae]